jgi:hypothetical protein
VNSGRTYETGLLFEPYMIFDKMSDTLTNARDAIKVDCLVAQAGM